MFTRNFEKPKKKYIYTFYAGIKCIQKERMATLEFKLHEKGYSRKGKAGRKYLHRDTLRKFAYGILF